MRSARSPIRPHQDQQDSAAHNPALFIRGIGFPVLANLFMHYAFDKLAGARSSRP